jgi:hypothetical protein
VNVNKCPYCFRLLGTWKKDPILLPNGCPNEWVSNTETTRQFDITQRFYKGFDQICEPEVQEIQDYLKQLEIDNSIIPLTIWSPLNTSGNFQVTGKHIKEMRDSIEKLLILFGLTKTDYFNYDEDRNLITQYGGGKVDWTDPITSSTNLKKFQVKYIHIEDLRHYIQVGLPDLNYPNSINVKIKSLGGNNYRNRFLGSFYFIGPQPPSAIITFYGGVPIPGWTIIDNDAKNFIIQGDFDWATEPIMNIKFGVSYIIGGITYGAFFSLDRHMYDAYPYDVYYERINLNRSYLCPTTGWTEWTHEFLWYIETKLDTYRQLIYHGSPGPWIYIGTETVNRTTGNFPPNDLNTYWNIHQDPIDGWVKEGHWWWRFNDFVSGYYGIKGINYTEYIDPDSYWYYIRIPTKLVTKIAAWKSSYSGWQFIKNITVTAEMDDTI